MKKRIKKFAEQASNTSDYGLECVTDKFLEHFAELIVKECLSVIEEMNPHDPERDIDEIFTEVAQYFGIDQ